MKGPLVDMSGAIDMHCHPSPDLFPRLADDAEVVEHARGMGFGAMMIKSHYEPSASRAAFAERMFPGIRVFGGIVLNHAVGGVNPAAVEAALQLGAREVWMPTVDAKYHAEIEEFYATTLAPPAPVEEAADAEFKVLAPAKIEGSR